MKYIVLIFFFSINYACLSSSPIQDINTNQTYQDNFETIYFNSILSDSSKPKSLLKTKLIAITLAITLGYFGVHRLYLGTKPIVPIAYTLTIGGGGFILPLIDIFYIIAAKDINQIINNDFVFMWNKKVGN
ncbi:MAG: NINE protein [Flavobacteriales bacterium]